jgi:hypothetical protein
VINQLQFYYRTDGSDGYTYLGMENIEWLNVVAGGLALTLLLGGMLMMFTTIWTTKGTNNK